MVWLREKDTQLIRSLNFNGEWEALACRENPLNLRCIAMAIVSLSGCYLACTWLISALSHLAKLIPAVRDPRLMTTDLGLTTEARPRPTTCLYNLKAESEQGAAAAVASAVHEEQELEQANAPKTKMPPRRGRGPGGRGRR